MQVVTTAGMVATLGVIQTALKAAGALGAATLHLFQNDFAPNTDSVVGDLVEADFDGYADVTLTLTVGPYLNAQSQAEIQQTSHNWTPTGSVTPNIIYGYYVLTGGGDLYAAERFNTPRPMGSTLDSLTLLYTLIAANGFLGSVVQPTDH